MNGSEWPAGTAGVVELPDGRKIRGRGLVAQPNPDIAPDFGLYVRSRDPGPFAWPYAWVPWPDFGTPSSTEGALAALREAHSRAATERVEVACLGGTGRTGTVLAVMAILAGVPGDDAVAWVREHYRPHAVETPGQKRWISEVAEALDV